jgi:tetratricopeptide (TPR) repeat protein
MPQIAVPKSHTTRNVWVSIAVVAGLLVLVVLVAFAVQVVRQKPVEAVLKQADELSAQRKSLEAVSLLEDRQAWAFSKEDRYKLAMGLGRVYENGSQYAQARTQYEKAAKLRPGLETDEALGGVAVKLGDKAAASTYYQKVVDFYERAPKNSGNYKEYYQRLLDEVNGK